MGKEKDTTPSIVDKIFHKYALIGYTVLGLGGTGVTGAIHGIPYAMELLARSERSTRMVMYKLCDEDWSCVHRVKLEVVKQQILEDKLEGHEH